MLELKNISRQFQTPEGIVHALKDVSLAVAPGEFVVVRGPSGSGKTTLLLTGGSLLQPTAGEVLIAEVNPYELSPNARSTFRASHVGFAFQQFHLIPYLNVLENVLAPAAACPGSDATARARELIAQLNLEHRINHLPAKLSTGERQRTALARALLNQPKLLLADEPTGNLDEESGDRILAHLQTFVNNGGAALVVTHDSRLAEHAHRILELKDGALKSPE